MRKKYSLSLIACLILIFAFAGCSSMPNEKKPETYPTHPIKLIVPFAPGGAIDLHARALQKVAAKHLGVALQIYNKTGGGGNIGLSEVARSNPDGYTLGTSSPEIIFHSLYGTTKYHYLTALDPVAQLYTSSFLLTVNADSPWQSLDDAIQYFKTNRKPIKFAHSGFGSAGHVLGEYFGRTLGIETLQAPFRGGSESLTTLLGNHVDMVFLSPSPTKNFIKQGKLRVLATTAPKRMKDPLFADVPTFKELGIDIEFTNWVGICTPKPLPPEIKAQIAAALKEMILDPEYQAAAEMLGSELEYLGPEECQEKWIADTQRLKKMLTKDIINQVRGLQGMPPTP